MEDGVHNKDVYWSLVRFSTEGESSKETSLSPMLFCICVTPVSYAMRDTPSYQPSFLQEPITHLMFVDDLKVYAKGTKQLDKCLQSVENISKAIGMALGLPKCATASLRKGKITNHEEHTPVPCRGEVLQVPGDSAVDQI